MSKVTVVIDPGHGGHDPGGVSNGLKEKDIVLRLALMLGALLKALGINVIYTRTTDVFISLSQRARIANNANADLFISIHINAGGGITANGVEIFSYPGSKSGMELSKAILRQVLSDNIFKTNRGNKTANFAVLRLTKMTATLTETGFIDHKGDAQILRTKEREIANSIYKGILSYLNIPFEGVSKPINKNYIGKGDRGDNVKKLQEDLNHFGFNAGTPDGIAGSNTVAAIKRFQAKYGLTVDGLAGKATIGKINQLIQGGEVEMVKPQVPTNRKSKYYKIGDAHIIETTPDNIYIDVLGNNLHGANVYGMNGTFYDTGTAPVTSPNSCVFIAMNDGRAISNNAQFNGWKAPPRATLIYHTNGLMGFRQLQNINSIRNITQWAIGGYMVKPYMDFANEKIPGSINYKTAHSYVGYDAKGKIYLIVKPYHMIHEIVSLLDQLGIINCIVLDGGGSSQLNHLDGNFRASRRINTAVLLKEV